MIGPRDERSLSGEVAKAVFIAGLSALVTKLAEWAVEEMKARAKAADRPPSEPGT